MAIWGQAIWAQEVLCSFLLFVGAAGFFGHKDMLACAVVGV